MNGDLLSCAEAVVASAQRQGATIAEAYASQDEQLSLRAKDTELQWLRHATTVGIGLRVIIDKCTGYAYTSDLSPAGQTLLVEEAIINARHTPPDPWAILPKPTTPPPDVSGLTHQDFDTISFDDKVDVLQRLQSTAKATSPLITQTLRNHYGEDCTSVAIANSYGIAAEYTTTLAYVWIELAAEADGKVQAGNSFAWGRAASELEPERVGQEAAEQACRLLGSSPISTNRMPVVIAPLAAVNILTQIARMTSAEAVQRGRSLFRGQLDKPIAADIVDIIDDATLPGGIGSCPVDAEGVPSQRTHVVQKGVLQNLLHNTTTSYQAGTHSTGSARRTSYRAIPGVGTTNFFLIPGTQTPEQLYRAAWNGLHVVELMGLHAMNPITGQFVGTVRGFYIERGEPTYPVSEVTISGEYLSLLRNITAIGNDLCFSPGRLVVGSPSLLIPDIMVSGL